jgi:hypothetical protein
MLGIIKMQIPSPVIREEDLYVLGIMTEWVDGKNEFIPLRSGKSFDEIRPHLLGCHTIDTSSEPAIRNAYWEILLRDQVALAV